MRRVGVGVSGGCDARRYWCGCCTLHREARRPCMRGRKNKQKAKIIIFFWNAFGTRLVSRQRVWPLETGHPWVESLYRLKFTDQ